MTFAFNGNKAKVSGGNFGCRVCVDSQVTTHISRLATHWVGVYEKVAIYLDFGTKEKKKNRLTAHCTSLTMYDSFQQETIKLTMQVAAKFWPCVRPAASASD